MEIANELIPHIMKVVSGHSARSILKDPECFAYLLRFYDGICQWEEGSQTPVLHIGWAKPLVNTISKFDFEVRGQVVILEQDLYDEDDENCNNMSLKRLEMQDRKSTDKNGACDDTKNKSRNEIDSSTLHPDIRELTAACGEKLLNRDFLIQGGGEPFIGETDLVDVSPPINTSAEIFKAVMESSNPSKIVLSSEKMKGLKNLLLGEKLNTHAISLQLTAQSQVQVGGKKSVFKEPFESGITIRSKRSRRD